MDIPAYSAPFSPDHRAVCTLLAQQITDHLPGSVSKIWHAHPVWFLDGNPIVGYSKQKAGIRLMFWSGASFDEPLLSLRGGKFQDASLFYNRPSDVNPTDLQRWLRKSTYLQWDYKNIVKRKGQLLQLHPMTRLTFALPIHAPASAVYRTMLGLPDPATYDAWTAVFNPTSTFRGDWSLHSKMHFIGVDEHGHTSGMVSRITQHDPARLVSIQHYGLVQNDDEITTGPDVEKWANGFEIYTFDPTPDGHTLLTVHLDTAPDFVGFMEETYPKALQRLKELCEAAH